MDRKPLIGVCILVVVLLAISSVTSMKAYAVDEQLFSSINEKLSISDSSRGETELKYYSEENLDQVVGFAGGHPMIWKTAIRLTQDEMALYSDWTMTKVNVAFSGESAQSEIDVRIYVYGKGSTSTIPGPIIVNDTTAHLNMTGVTTIPLVTPINLSEHEELWVAVEWYETEVGPGIYYAWIDTLSGPHVENKSDFYYAGTHWSQLHDGLPECDGRWGIGAIIQGPDHTDLSIGIIKGFLGIRSKVSNVGGYSAENVTCSISITGGILNRINITITEKISPLEAGASIEIKSGIFSGFGYINIVLSAKADNSPEIVVKKIRFLLGPFVIHRKNWFYVGGSGPGNYTIIQDAINDADEGDHLFVFSYSSPYYESILIDKSLSVIGENKETTIIDGNNSGPGITITANNTLLQGFTVQNCVTLKVFSNSNRICDNIFRENKYGLTLESADKNRILNNTFIDSDFYGVFLNHMCQNNEIKNNIISHSVFSGVYLHYSTHNTVSNNKISNGLYEGITVFFSDFNTLENNSIDSNLENGISLGDESDNNGISHNIISNNSRFGIWAEVSSNNTFSNNRILSNNLSGMQFEDFCCNNVISDNFIEGNHGYAGIRVANAFNNNLITDNVFLDNDNYGIKIEPYENCENNLMYHNTFIDNTINAYDPYTNSWNSSFSVGGNYWSDYTGQDLNGDGIGDTPYDIPGGSNKDFYPLMEPNNWLTSPRLEWDSQGIP